MGYSGCRLSADGSRRLHHESTNVTVTVPKPAPEEARHQLFPACVDRTNHIVEIDVRCNYVAVPKRRVKRAETRPNNISDLVVSIVSRSLARAEQPDP
jgi:hypothetical protein